MSLRWLLLASATFACHPSVYRCRAAATAELWEQATVVCAAAFDETGDPWTGLNLARAYLYRNDDARARAVAERLLTTPWRADALSLVGTLEDRGRHGPQAEAALEEARRLHALQGNRRMVARDAYALAGVLAREGRYPHVPGGSVSNGDLEPQGIPDLGRRRAHDLGGGDDLGAHRQLRRVRPEEQQPDREPDGRGGEGPLPHPGEERSPRARTLLVVDRVQHLLLPAGRRRQAGQSAECLHHRIFRAFVAHFLSPYPPDNP